MIAKKNSFTMRLLEYLVARPNDWVDGLQLSGIAGAYAWRTRVSEARKILEAEGKGTIKNRCQTVHREDGSRFTRSQYCFVPAEQHSLSVNADGQTCFL